LKTKRNWLVATFLTILLVSLTAPALAISTRASSDREDNISIEEFVPHQWYKLETDIITVLFPASGKKPMFIWWYTNEPDQVYVVKYKGLIEYFEFDDPLLPPASKPEFYKRIREAIHERFEEWFLKPQEEKWMAMGQMWRLELLWRIMNQIREIWHSHFLPFSAGQWNLSDWSYLNSTDGEVIGVAFAFKLVSMPLPQFKFAENNIVIRVRFYNESVIETVPGTDYSYEVSAGEMKMDLVINEWQWNIDRIKQLIDELRENGIDVSIPMGKTRLALWINLSSINFTERDTAINEPLGSDTVETVSTAYYMDIEDLGRMPIMSNDTLKSGEEGQEKPVEVQRPWWAPQPRKPVKLRFVNETKMLAGFFRFVPSAKITDYPNEGGVSMQPVKASYIAGGRHMRLFIGYPYFGNGTLEHDPSIGVDVAGVDTTPKYTVQAPSGSEVAPIVLGKYVLPLFTPELMIALIAIVSATAIILYVAKWKRKTPVNMVGVGTTS